MATARSAVVCLALLAVLLPMASALSPLDLLPEVDLETLYDRHQPWIDFALYLFFFISLSLQILGRHFPGSTGRALSVAVGMMLSVALIVAERSMGFSLRSLGPLAVFVLIIIIAMLVALSLRQLGAHTVTAMALAVLLLYFSMKLLGPAVYPVRPEFELWSATLVLASFVVLLVRAAQFVLRKSQERHGDHEEGSTLLVLSRATRQSGRDTRALAGALQKAKKGLRGGASSTYVKSLLQQAQQQQREQLAGLARQRELLKRLRNLDIAAYQQLRKRYQGEELKSKAALLRTEVEAEVKKLQVDQKLERAERLLADLAEQVAQCVQLAQEQLEQGAAERAGALVSKAVEHLAGMKAASKQVRKLEKQLKRLLAYEGYLAEREAA